MLHFPILKFWKEEELYELQVQAVSRFMKVDTPFAVEACVEFAKFLNALGLDPDNYPLYLQLLRDENRFVVEALVGKEKAFDLFTGVQPNPYIIRFCFQILRDHAPGGVNNLTLETIFGILYRTYHSAKEGHALHSLSIEDVNAVGKYLDKTREQNDSINRFILDILADIAEYRSINNEDPVVDKNSAHATAIRNAFFDRRRAMDSVMPPEILVRRNYNETLVKPRSTRKFTETVKKGK
jgi:hypothetical protein